MSVYVVAVRNELTGEVETVVISTYGAADAQVQALTHLFRSKGWRKAVAFQPEVSVEGLIEEVA